VTSVLCSVFTFFTINANFYPHLLNYQAGNQLAAISKCNNVDQRRVFTFQQPDVNYSYHFYTSTFHRPISLQAVKTAQTKDQKFWVLTDEAGKVYLQQNNVRFNNVLSKRDYRITRLKPKFLNPGTREEVTSKLYLIEL
jgi:hypothetical protein